MSKVKIILIIVLVIVVVGSLGGATYYFANKQFLDSEKDGSGDIKYLVIGDSIAEALMGTTPISEKENYGYYGVLGQRNGFEYYNRSISGSTSKACLEFLQRTEDSGVNLEYSLLREADVIQLSILGNDFLLNQLDDLFFDIADGNMERINSIVADSTITFAQIIDTIKEANPTADLYVQTVYNPYYEGSKIIIPSLIERLRAIDVVEIAQLRELSDKLITRLNSIVYDYDRNNPGTFTLVDVYEEFKAIYEEDNDYGSRLILADGVHPSSHGHAVIADLTQEIFEAKGYVKSPEYALRKYQELRVDQLNRLYRKTDVNFAKARSDVMNAQTYKEITAAYFDAIYNVVPIY